VHEYRLTAEDGEAGIAQLALVEERLLDKKPFRRLKDSLLFMNVDFASVRRRLPCKDAIHSWISGRNGCTFTGKETGVMPGKGHMGNVG
jgi:hypothetical protein